MTTTHDDPENRDRPGRAQEERSGDAGENPRPFDTSELGNIPQPHEDDPPYRDWWVAHSDNPGDTPGREPSPS